MGSSRLENTRDQKSSKREKAAVEGCCFCFALSGKGAAPSVAATRRRRVVWDEMKFKNVEGRNQLEALFGHLLMGCVVACVLRFHNHPLLSSISLSLVWLLGTTAAHVPPPVDVALSCVSVGGGVGGGVVYNVHVRLRVCPL
jgi:hypothetical protein